MLESIVSPSSILSRFTSLYVRSVCPFYFPPSTAAFKLDPSADCNSFFTRAPSAPAKITPAVRGCNELQRGGKKYYFCRGNVHAGIPITGERYYCTCLKNGVRAILNETRTGEPDPRIFLQRTDCRSWKYNSSLWNEYCAGAYLLKAISRLQTPRY